MISSTASKASSSLETPQHPRSRRHIVWIVLLWAIIYIPGLFRPALLDDADSVHAEAAREMMARHDWSTLYIDGIRYLEKAPLLYWGMATSYEVFGVRDWAARIPLILGVLALLLVTYSLGRRTLGERAELLERDRPNDVDWPVSLHAISDSRHAGGTVAGVGHGLLPAHAGGRDAVDCVVLGTGRDRRPQCADQGTDRHRLSRQRSSVHLPFADRQSTKHLLRMQALSPAPWFCWRSPRPGTSSPG